LIRGEDWVGDRKKGRNVSIHVVSGLDNWIETLGSSQGHWYSLSRALSKQMRLKTSQPAEKVEHPEGQLGDWTKGY
jgi:hypothetical protein